MSYINSNKQLVLKTTLTKTDINNLGSTPIQILPTPTSGYTHMVDGIFGYYNRAGSPNFAGGVIIKAVMSGFSNNIEAYSDGAFLSTYTDTVNTVLGLTGVNVGFTHTYPLVLKTTGSITSGHSASTVDVMVSYRIVKIN